MPKKKVNKNNPESLKEAGNKALVAGKYDEALELYNQAIELSKDAPNHIYYSNRAEVYLQLKKYEECLADCEVSLDINKEYAKSYFRKATALTYLQKLVEANETFKRGYELDPENKQYKKMSEEVELEIYQDNILPEDHPEKVGFKNMT